MNVKISLFLLAATAHISAAAFVEGDQCGVNMGNFLEDEFLGSYAVAGPGCTLSDGAEPCFCAPDLQDTESLSEWKWQCGDDVQFGPKNDKVCPASVPIPKKYGVDSILFTEALLGVPVVCDPDIHPTGYPGDEVCAYSECESGGEYSALCACVDLAVRGVENGGTQWFCLHATCQCEADEEEDGDATVESEPKDSGVRSTLAAAGWVAPLAVAAALV